MHNFGKKKKKKSLLPARHQSWGARCLLSEVKFLDVVFFLYLLFNLSYYFLSFLSSVIIPTPPPQPSVQPSLLSGNWVFDLHASEHVEIILAVMTRKEKKIKHQRGDRKAEPDEAEVGLRARASERGHRSDSLAHTAMNKPQIPHLLRKTVCYPVNVKK